MRNSLTLLLATFACAADLPIGPQLTRGEITLTLNRYSTAQIAPMTGGTQAEMVAKSDLRGEGLLIVWRTISPMTVGAAFEVTGRRGSETVRASQYCRAALVVGSMIQCAVPIGPFDAITDLKAYVAILSRSPLQF